MKPINLIKPYFIERRKLILSGLVCLITVDLLQLIIPRIIKAVVDGLTSFQIGPMELFRHAVHILLLAMVIASLRYVWRRCLLGTSRRVEEGLRNRLFAHLQTLSAGYFDRVSTGDLMAHATNDIQQVRMASGMGLVALNDAVFLGAAAVGFMLYIHVGLTLLVLIPAPLIVFGTRFFSRRMHRRYQRVQAAFSDLTEAIRERFAGVRIVKAYGLADQSGLAVRSISRAYISENLSLARIVGSFFPMMLFLSNLSLAAVLYFGGRQTIFMNITPGDFVAFISYLALITWPMMAIGWMTNLIQRGRASLDRIAAILQTQPEIVESEAAIALNGITDRIVYEDVGFDHPAAKEEADPKPVLNDIRFSLPAGEILGIVGPPGSGKTTLLQLLPRLYDVSRGRIRIDGEDIRNFRLADLRKQMALMPQEPFLFAGTIRENITFEQPHITESDLIAAAKSAALYETVKQFPDGFDTIVGEKGVVLSGGQKQRISLARCLLSDAPIILLDDPISQVDSATGAEIIKTIRSLTPRKTLLIVSHRLSAVRFADRIATLQDGRITETGTHRQLLRKNSYYARTFRLQQIEEEYHAD